MILQNKNGISFKFKQCKSRVKNKIFNNQKEHLKLTRRVHILQLEEISDNNLNICTTHFFPNVEQSSDEI